MEREVAPRRTDREVERRVELQEVPREAVLLGKALAAHDLAGRELDRSEQAEAVVVVAASRAYRVAAGVGRVVVAVHRIDDPLRVVQVVAGALQRAVVLAGEVVGEVDLAVFAQPVAVGCRGVDVAAGPLAVVVQPKAQPGGRGQRVGLPAVAVARRVVHAGREVHRRAGREAEIVSGIECGVDVAAVVVRVHVGQGLLLVDAAQGPAPAAGVEAAEAGVGAGEEGVLPAADDGHVADAYPERAGARRAAALVAAERVLVGGKVVAQRTVERTAPLAGEVHGTHHRGRVAAAERMFQGGVGTLLRGDPRRECCILLLPVVLRVVQVETQVAPLAVAVERGRLGVADLVPSGVVLLEAGAERRPERSAPQDGALGFRLDVHHLLLLGGDVVRPPGLGRGLLVDAHVLHVRGL